MWKPSTKSRNHGASLAVLALLVMSFMALAVTFQPAHAITPISCAPGGGQTGGVSFTSGHTTTTIAITLGSSCNVIGNLLMVGFYYTIPPVQPALGTLILTDTAGNSWKQDFSTVYVKCVGAPTYLGTCAQADTYPMLMLMYSTLLTTTATSLTITLSSVTAFAYNAIGAFSFQIWTGVANKVAATCSAGYGYGSTFPGSVFPGFPSCTLPVPANGLALSFEVYSESGSVAPPYAPVGAMTYLAASTNAFGIDANHCSQGSFLPDYCVNASGFSVNGNSTASFVVGGLACNDTGCASNSMFVMGVSFGAGAIASTSTGGVKNTECLGAGCSDGANSTSTYAIATTDRFVFEASQNLENTAFVDNFTMKIAAVHINATSNKAYVLVYSTSPGTGAPSGGNPYHLVKSYPFPLINNTVDSFLHVNPQALICGSCYYAVGIMITSFASRTVGASGSGVSFYEASQLGVRQFVLDVGSATPPSVFFTDSEINPHLFMSIETVFTVASSTSISTSFTANLTITTSTSTITTSTVTCPIGSTCTTTTISTLSCASGATCTSTETFTLVTACSSSCSTFTVTQTHVVVHNVNAPNMSAFNMWFLPLLFAFVPPAVFIIVLMRLKYQGGKEIELFALISTLCSWAAWGFNNTQTVFMPIVLPLALTFVTLFLFYRGRAS